jgi:hypothetical protein
MWNAEYWCEWYIRKVIKIINLIIDPLKILLKMVKLNLILQKYDMIIIKAKENLNLLLFIKQLKNYNYTVYFSFIISIVHEQFLINNSPRKTLKLKNDSMTIWNSVILAKN